MESRTSFESNVLAAFATAGVVVAILFSVTWKLAGDATEATHLVTRTHEVMSSLAHIRADTLQIELNTQSFRISGDTTFLTERDAAIAAREAALSQLRQLTLDHIRQQEQWAQLREVINQRLALARQVELLRKTQGVEAANAFVAGAPLRETRQRTYQLLNAMEDEESRLLASRSAAQSATRQTMITVGALVAALLLVMLAASFCLIRRQLLKTSASQLALANSEESLATTLHSIGDAVLASDTQGRVTHMNPVAEQLTGWSFAQAQGRPTHEVFRIVHEQTRVPCEDPVAKVLATGEAQELANHTSIIARDGRECAIADSAAPIRDTAGRITGVVLVFRDETLNRQARRSVHAQNELLEQRVHERTVQLHESEDHLRSVISNVPALIAYVDAQRRYLYVNDQYRERFAPTVADISGCTVREILGEERYAIAAPLITQVLAGQPQTYDWQPFPGVWQVINYIPRRDAQGQVIGYYVLGSDITERKRSEEKILALNSELEQRVKELEHVTRALRTLSAGNRTMIKATLEQGLLESMCMAIVTAGGYDMAAVWYREDDASHSSQPMAEFGYPGGMEALHKLRASWSDKAPDSSTIARAIRTGETCVVEDMSTIPHLHPYLYGLITGVACPIRVDGAVIGAVGIYHAKVDTFRPDEVDLLAEMADDLGFGIANLRARATQQNSQKAMHLLTHSDALTGLPNETEFTELLTAAIDTGTRLQQPFAVLQANIERLSEINDALGFDHGDQLLQEFAARFSSAAPHSASVARLRGDEFAMLLPNSDVQTATAMAQQLEDALSQPFAVADIDLNVSAKFGISLFPAHGSTPHDLYRHMDIAVHQAKKNGVQHVVFDPSQNHSVPHRLNMAGELRHAIEGGDLVLHLQPKVEMTTGRVCGAEGLVRWKHAKRGMIPPGEFIGLAEHTGLIQPLTEWVITTAFDLLQDWERKGCALPIAVNLSARNLRDESLLGKIRLWQTAWGTKADFLEMEITESAVMENAELALTVLHGLREAGIPLYIDDFGTGYSSLSYLQKLPVDYIKIDQSFVSSMTVNKDSAVIVRSTIDLVHDLGRKTVAEGVETQEQWDLLMTFGCDYAQGYFIARPMPAEDFLGWVAGRNPVT